MFYFPKPTLILFILYCWNAIGYAQNPDSIWDSGIKKFDRMDFHGVIEDMNKLTDINPGYYSAVYNRGVARLNLGDEEGACADMELAKSLGMEDNLGYMRFFCDKETSRDNFIKEYYDKVKVYPELGYRPLYTRADSLRGALRAERTCFNVHFYDLTVQINPKRKRIKGTNRIYFNIEETSRKIQIDLFDNLKINKISWNGQSLDYKREYNAVFIEFPGYLKQGENHLITISYHGKPVVAPNPPWGGGFVWEEDLDGNTWAGVACEHLGASCWWPNKDHLTDKPDSMLINLDVPENCKAVSNGNLRSMVKTGQGYDRYTWFVSYPINNYNVTFYLGKYVAFDDTLVHKQDTLMLNYNVLPYNLEKAKAHFKQTRYILEFYIDAFGDYPFQRDGFGLVESPYAGMEHQSAIAYGNAYTNHSIGYRNNLYDYIIVHEAAHEWWGNAVSVGDMADIWIHEGFATYAEILFLEKTLGTSEYLFELSRYARYIFNIWPLVQNRDVNENAFVSNDIYNKGAMMLHCLRCNINNDSLFFKLIKDFARVYLYETVTSNDFIAFVTQYTEQDYRPFFNKFLYDTRLPVLAYTYQAENGYLKIKYRWTEVEDGFTMPFAIETSQNKSYRLEATTEWKEKHIPGASWFNFYNIWRGYEGCPANSYTYFWTSCENQ